MNRKQLRPILIALIGIVGVTLIVIGALTSGGADDGGASSSASPPVPSASGDSRTAGDSGDRPDDPGLARRDPTDPIALGEADAPVVIVEYADFRCPFCAQFTRETLPDLIDEYVDAGLVRYEFRDLPLFGEESEAAAAAGRAAGRQGRFWEFLETVHAAAPATGHPEITEADLVAFAKKAGVDDVERFRNDLSDPSLRRDIQKDVRQAQSVGVNSVPFFAIDNIAVSGAQPLHAFQKVIDEQLAARGIDVAALQD